MRGRQTNGVDKLSKLYFFYVITPLNANYEFLSVHDTNFTFVDFY